MRLHPASITMGRKLGIVRLWFAIFLYPWEAALPYFHLGTTLPILFSPPGQRLLHIKVQLLQRKPIWCCMVQTITWSEKKINSMQEYRNENKETMLFSGVLKWKNVDYGEYSEVLRCKIWLFFKEISNEVLLCRKCAKHPT